MPRGCVRRHSRHRRAEQALEYFRIVLVASVLKPAQQVNDVRAGKILQ